MNQILLPLENSKMTLLKKLKWPYFTDNSPKILKQPKDIPKNRLRNVKWVYSLCVRLAQEAA